MAHTNGHRVRGTGYTDSSSNQICIPPEGNDAVESLVRAAIRINPTVNSKAATAVASIPCPVQRSLAELAPRI